MRVQSVVTLVLLAACSENPPLAGGRPEPFITMTLIAGESVQVATVLYGLHPDSNFPFRNPPVPDHLVSLTLTGPGGLSQPVMPAFARPGVFQTTLNVVPGGTYQLTGSVDGVPLTATTTVPSSFVIVAPAADTIVVSRSPFGYDTLSYHFRAVGAAGFEATTIGQHLQGGMFAPAGDTLGLLRFNEVFPDTSAVPLLFLAYNADASRWIQHAIATGNIIGLRGGFGAALIERRMVRYP